MAMVAGDGAITHTADHSKDEEEEKDDQDNTELQVAEMRVQDDAPTRVEDDAATRVEDDAEMRVQVAEMRVQDNAATRDQDDATSHADGDAGDSPTASTLTPFIQPPPTTDPAGQGAPVRAMARAAGNATSGQSQPQLGSPAASEQLTATTVQTADPATVIPVPQGQTAAVPPGSTITLGNDTTMCVNSGSVTVVGAGTRVANLPVTINVGSTVDTLSRCYAGDTVIPADTRLTASSCPIALTQYRHAQVEVELVSGSATTNTGTQIGEVTTHAREGATAAVGAAGASITNTVGTVTITTGQSPQGTGGLQAAPAPGD